MNEIKPMKSKELIEFLQYHKIDTNEIEVFEIDMMTFSLSHSRKGFSVEFRDESISDDLKKILSLIGKVGRLEKLKADPKVKRFKDCFEMMVFIEDWIDLR